MAKLTWEHCWEDERCEYSYIERYGQLYAFHVGGHESWIANFTARITEEIRRHQGGADGVLYRIDLTHCDPSIGKQVVVVDASHYQSMNWVYDAGTEFRMAAGAWDHVRAAIQAFSKRRDEADIPSI
jgi:hypothetical protein